MTAIDYTPILTEASYIFAKTEMEYTLDLLRALPVVPVATTTGTIIKPNLAEQRRNDGLSQPFGAPMETRIADTSTVAYSTRSYYGAYNVAGIEAMNVGGLTSTSAQSHMVELATMATGDAFIKWLKGFADTFMNDANYGSGSKTDPTDWTVSTADLVKQITDKVTQVKRESGGVPDTIIVTEDVHAIIRNNVNVLDALAGFGASTSQGADLGNFKLPLQNFARIFGVQNYFVLDTYYNGAGFRATASNVSVASKKLLIACMGKNMSLNGSTINNYAGLGVCPYVDVTPLSGAEFRIASGSNSLPFPVVTRNAYVPGVTGGGEHKIYSEIIAGFQLVEPLYGHLLYNVIA